MVIVIGSENKVCSACGATENLRSSPWHAPLMICRPCFLVWYDPPITIDETDPAEVGKLSLALKALGRWPWVQTGKVGI